MSYREAHIACHRPLNGPAQVEITGDEVRDHLTRSVLPRLATEGWILESPDGDWNSVRPRVPWWGQTPEARQIVYDALLEAARRAAQRAKPVTARAKSASVLEGMDLAKSFKGRRVVDHVTVRVQQGEIVGLLGPERRGKDDDLLPYYGADPARRRPRAAGRAGPDPRADVPPGRQGDRVPRPGALDLSENDGRGKYSGDPGNPAAQPGRAAQAARSDAGRAVDQAPPPQQGLRAERRASGAGWRSPGRS